MPRVSLFLLLLMLAGEDKFYDTARETVTVYFYSYNYFRK